VANRRLDSPVNTLKKLMQKPFILRSAILSFGPITGPGSIAITVSPVMSSATAAKSPSVTSRIFRQSAR
jgi:hypothetical protein